MPANLLTPVGPAPIYAQQGDVLLLDITPAVTISGVSYLVGYRMQVASTGLIQTFQNTWAPGSIVGGQPNFYQIPLPEGWLLGVSVQQIGSTNNSSLAIGQKGHILTQLYYGPGNQTVSNLPNSGLALLSDNIAGANVLSWPTMQPQSPVSGQGANILTTVSNPSAGANFSFTFSSIYRVQIQNIRFTLTTSATVANRVVGVTFTYGGTGGGIYCSSQCPTAQVASTTCNYNFGVAVGASSSTAVAAGLVPEQITSLPAGLQLGGTSDVLASIVSGIQAADQISNVAIRYTIWNEQD